MIVYVPSIVEYHTAEDGRARVLGVFTTEKFAVDKLIEELLRSEMIDQLDEEKQTKTFKQLLHLCDKYDNTSYYNQTWHIQLDTFKVDE